jgi:predicted aspartyl protease
VAQATRLVTPAYPYVEIAFVIDTFRSPTVLAYVDSGFDGYLLVPAAQSVLFGPSQFSTSWELGDGSVVQAQEYRGEVQVVGLPLTVPARITFLGEEYLLGRGVVDRLRMTFDRGQRLILEI